MDDVSKDMVHHVYSLELLAEIKRLTKIEQAALAVMKAFGSSIDYNTWDKALDALEATLKEK